MSFGRDDRERLRRMISRSLVAAHKSRKLLEQTEKLVRQPRVHFTIKRPYELMTANNLPSNSANQSETELT
jgi:hypothetical protein